MRVYIQTENLLIDKNVSGVKSFVNLCVSELRTLGNKLFLVMSDDNSITGKPSTFLVTSSVTDIEAFFEEIHIGKEMCIQVFDFNDFKEVIKYLESHYEIKDEIKPPNDIQYRLN